VGSKATAAGAGAGSVKGAAPAGGGVKDAAKKTDPLSKRPPWRP
jgi:hypothetical protein